MKTHKIKNLSIRSFIETLIIRGMLPDTKGTKGQNLMTEAVFITNVFQ